MKKSKNGHALLAAATLGVMSALAMAAQAQEISTDQPLPQPPPDTTTTTAQPQTVAKCSQLIGMRVENSQGQKLGRIADVVVSFDKENVSYCLLRVGHGAFAQSRYLAVPLAAFQPSQDRSHLILNADRANLEKARGLARNEWPTAINPVWGAEATPAPIDLPPVVVFPQQGAITLNARDNRFVSEFANTSLEIERIAQLAQTQSQNAQVKEMVQKIAQDYKQAGQRVATCAQTAGESMTSQMDNTSTSEINTLAGLSGEAFDQAALRELYRCVEAGVRQLDTEADKGGSSSMRQLAGTLQETSEPDVWQTTLLSAEHNGHP